VIAYQEKGQATDAKDAVKRLLSARPDFTIAAWLKTQFRRDSASLEADVATLRMAGLPRALAASEAGRQMNGYTQPNDVY
jgi:hypothetical protein